MQKTERAGCPAENRVEPKETQGAQSIEEHLPIDVIHDITGLDIETIKQLAINN